MMNTDDQEKTAFVTGRGTYCNRVMTLGLKNAGATYQRLVNRMLSEQHGKTMEVYIDDMLVKSLEEQDHVNHLQEWFKSACKTHRRRALFLYIAVSITAVSGVLIREERSEQKPIFYVSKTSLDAETRYPLLEKLALAVVMSAQKLRPCFQSHMIVVLTSFSLPTNLHNPSQSGRLAKWAVELNEYDIEYRAKACAKSQVLADFMVELPTGCTTNQEPDLTWTLHVDGSLSKQVYGIGIRLTSPTGEVLEQSFPLIFPASNNEDEYEALIVGL
ncbi:hypothetical protein N665_0683s0007 [Sinapis alba]|nr:hypothetical protein N665_0683s0007 [Sinapis alba]